MARTVLFRGAATVHTAGISSDTANVVALTIENGAASGVTVEVQALGMAPVYPNQPMANPAEARTATAMPSGGTVLDKNRILGSGSSDAAVVVRGARTAADAASAITATGTQARVCFVAHSKHIQSGNQQGIYSNQNVLRRPVILLPGEALVVTQLPDWVSGLVTANHRTFYSVTWEEFTVPTSTPISGSDSGTGSESGTVSVTLSGSEAPTGTDAGSVSATVAGSDSGSGTDAQVSIVSPVSGSEAATGTDTGSVSASVPGSESATGTDAGSATVTGSGSETGTGSEAGGVSATVTGSDSAVGTEAGTVVDVTGGPTVITDSDSATGTDAGVVVDLTVPLPPEITGGRAADLEAEELEYPLFRALYDSDAGVGFEVGLVADVTPTREPAFTIPRRVVERLRRPSREPVRVVVADDAAVGREDGVVVVAAASADAGRGVETGRVEVLADPAEADDLQALALLGLL